MEYDIDDGQTVTFCTEGNNFHIAHNVITHFDKQSTCIDSVHLYSMIYSPTYIDRQRTY